MKFDIPKIIRPLEMVEYDEAMTGLALQVWVNPSRHIHNEYWTCQSELVKATGKLGELVKKPDAKKTIALDKKIDKCNQKVYAWFARLWSQSEDQGTHVSVEEIEAMAEEDPAIWRFMINRTMKLIRDHQENIRKN